MANEGHHMRYLLVGKRSAERLAPGRHNTSRHPSARKAEERLVAGHLEKFLGVERWRDTPFTSLAMTGSAVFSIELTACGDGQRVVFGFNGLDAGWLAQDVDLKCDQDTQGKPKDAGYERRIVLFGAHMIVLRRG
jgi:hypothetical protein